jgi:hypothetical protein
MSQPEQKNSFQQRDHVAQPQLPGVCSAQTTREEKMFNVVRLSKRLVPVEHIALFEPFVPPTDPPLRTSREFKGRVVLLDRVSVLSEQTPEELSELYGFRFVKGDRVGTNPSIPYRVETFTPAENFRPTKEYLSRLVWNDREGNTQSKLMLSSPEELIAVAVRGESDADMSQVLPSPEAKRPRRARARVKQNTSRTPT